MDINWPRIRAFYLQCMQTKRLTQKVIIARGGIRSQSLLSRMINNDGYGPTVEIFVRAVRGLGMDILQFFTELERHERTLAQHEESYGRSPSPRASGGLTDAQILAAIAQVSQESQTLAARIDDLRSTLGNARRPRPARAGDPQGSHDRPAPDPAFTDSRSPAEKEANAARPAARR
jgi:hypothetical protein